MTAKEIQVFYLISFILGLSLGVALYAFFTVNIFISLLIAFIASVIIFLIIGVPAYLIISKKRRKNV